MLKKRSSKRLSNQKIEEEAVSKPTAKRPKTTEHIDVKLEVVADEPSKATKPIEEEPIIVI